MNGNTQNKSGCLKKVKAKEILRQPHHVLFVCRGLANNLFNIKISGVGTRAGFGLNLLGNTLN